MAYQPVLTVEGLLRSRSDALGLPLEILGGRAGLDRRIGSPHIQKTGLALAGFHEYLQPGRILVFGESEVRYLESLDGAVRAGIAVVRVSGPRAGQAIKALARRLPAPRRASLCRLDHPDSGAPIDEALVLLDNAIDLGQPQPTAHAWLFGGKKRLKDVLHDFRCHPTARISHRQADI